MLSMDSGYFVGSLILGLIYLAFWIWRKDLRKEMLFGGLLLIPFALFAPLFIPEYWDPPFLFGQLPYWGIAIEDFLFSFFVGGISSVIYEVATGKREIKLRGKKRLIAWTPYLFGILLFLVLEWLYPRYSIISMTAVGITAGAIMLLKRRDLAVQALTAGLVFALLYFCFFKIFGLLYPSFIEAVYQHQNLLGIYLAGIPVEEVFFAFAVGMGWSVSYEYILSYRTSS